MGEAVYLLCALTSLACAALLLSNYTKSRNWLTLWTSVCFVALAANNVLLFVDLVLTVETISLAIWRNSVGLLGVSALLYGMIQAEHS